MAGAKLQVEGVAETLRELRKVSPELVKELTKEIRDIGRPIVADAKKRVPAPNALSNWGGWTTSGADGRAKGRDLSFNREARKGVKAKSNRTPGQNARRYTMHSSGRQFQVIPLLELRQMSPAGAIFERAGSRSATKLSRSLNTKYGQVVQKLDTTRSGRALYPAVYSKEGRIVRDSVRVVRRIEREANRRLAR